MNDPIDDYKLETIPIERIDVINPRARNKKIFKEIISNIADIGLKGPSRSLAVTTPMGRDMRWFADKADLRPIRRLARKKSQRTSSKLIWKTVWS